jgi:hypothetical protein
MLWEDNILRQKEDDSKCITILKAALHEDKQTMECMTIAEKRRTEQQRALASKDKRDHLLQS